MERRTFDRSQDVSKLEGCNTRSIEYRWDLFTRELQNIPRGSEALDFGAGSLRDSFELTKRGYNVTAIDLNSELLASYERNYDWPKNGTARNIVTGQDLNSCLSQIDSKRFSLIISFDVLEHLEDPASILRQMQSLMSPDGRLFITVPNGRTLFELYFRFVLLLARAFGKKIHPGEPHLQRNSPKKWTNILQDSGLKVLHHAMGIGFFANTFYALVQIPVFGVGRLLSAVGVSFPSERILDFICSKNIMAKLDKLDRHTERYFYGLYGWNLFVAARSLANDAATVLSRSSASRDDRPTAST
jgi:2-polyprenyl-3-methyl-5-hydroxy-6-metoxy-1,4-benzoquinol methylase